MEIFLPIGGVVVGWFLSELAGAFRIVREERQCLKAALPPLLQFYFEQYRINEILTFFNTKMGHDLECIFNEVKTENAGSEKISMIVADYISQFEELRKINISMPKQSAENLSGRFEVMLDALSKVDPVAAFTAGKLFNEFALFQESEMPSFSENHSAYLSTLAAMLSIFRNDMKNLKLLILNISRQAGAVQYFQTRRLLKAEEAGLAGGIEKAHTKIFSNAI